MKTSNAVTDWMQFAGVAAILLGLTRVAAGVGYLLLPPEQRVSVAGAVFLPSFAQNPGLLTTIFWVEFLAGILGLAVVPALTRLIREENEGWARWSSTLAMIGFAISAMGYMLSTVRIPVIARAFVAGDASTKAALAVTWHTSPDLYGFWGYGAIGIWLLVVCLLALQSGAQVKVFPKAFLYLGILTAVLYMLVPVATLFKVQTLLLVGSAAGALVGPVWYIWTGLILMRSGKTVAVGIPGATQG